MLFNDASKQDYLWKLINNKSLTSVDKSFFEEALSAAREVNAADIWIDSALIPTTPPGVSGAIVEVVSDIVLTPDPSVPDQKAWAACSTPGDFSTRLRQWIPPRCGAGYTARLYNDDGMGGLGDEIYALDPLHWMFFEASGVLFCENSPDTLGKTLPLHLSAYRYVGTVGSLPPLPGTDKYFPYVQVVANTTWVIDHFLDKHPSVTLVGPSGPMRYDTLVYNTMDRLTLTFLSARSGIAELN